MIRYRVFGFVLLSASAFSPNLHGQIFSIHRILYGSPLIDSLPTNQFPRGGGYTATIQGFGLKNVTSFLASDLNVSGSVTSVSDTSVTVQISSTSVKENHTASAPILGVSFELLQTPPSGQPPLGPIYSGAVTFDIVAGPPPQVKSWKITNGVKWIPAGVKTTVTYQASILSAGNIQFVYIDGYSGGNITSWTGTTGRFSFDDDLTIEVTAAVDFNFRDWSTTYGAVDGAGQGGNTGQDPLSPSPNLDLPTVQTQFVDPVTSDSSTTLLAGPAVTSDLTDLNDQGHGTIVSGIAADGAGQLVVRIAGAPPNETFSLTLAQDGALADVGSTNFQSVIPALQADSLGNAVFLYRAPDDFPQVGTIATIGAPSRNVDLNYTSTDNPGVSGDTKIKIVRPPVVLIHGIWGKPANWNNFYRNLKSFLGAQLPFELFAVGYNLPLPTITSIQPSLPASSLPAVQAANDVSSLGFSFTSGIVLPQINLYIADFKDENNVAAVQADIVAHSMGGDITRTLPRFQSAYFTDNTFGAGAVHKLISIDTPHLGTPLAIDLLSTGGSVGDNSCVRHLFATKGMLPASSVSLTGFGATTVGGAAGDLQGDGFGGQLSAALSAIKLGTASIPTAFIAGNGCNAIDCPMGSTPATDFGLLQTALRAICHANPIAQALDSFDWPRLFSSEDSDAIVPLTSQTNQTGSAITFPVIHSEGTHLLGFVSPDVLGDIGVAHAVIQLLNTPRTTASTYTKLY
jgi:pimeloyl-ACP methyl ester carboxylesterase